MIMTGIINIEMCLYLACAHKKQEETKPLSGPRGVKTLVQYL